MPVRCGQFAEKSAKLHLTDMKVKKKVKKSGTIIAPWGVIHVAGICFMSKRVISCRKEQFHVGLGENTKPDMNRQCGDMKLQNPDMKMTT